MNDTDLKDTDRSDETTGRRRVWMLGGILTVLVLGVGIAVAASTGILGRPSAHTSANATGSNTATALIRVTDISAQVDISGTLGFVGSFPIVAPPQGTVLTWLPATGATIGFGQRIYEASGAPVVLLRGDRPAWRDFVAGMSDGEDIRQLKQNLRDLGFDPNHVLDLDDHFTPGTQAAIVRLQAELGIPPAERTGTLPLGSVAFAPAPLRIAALPNLLGSTVAGAPVLTATSLQHAVTAALPAESQGQVKPDDHVTVTLPDGSQIAGTVANIGAATIPDGSSSSNQSGSQPPTLPVTIAVTLPTAAAALDAAPVQVSITTATHAHALTVPITALLARPGGGYQVRVIGAHTTQLVTVQPGLFNDVESTVEIRGAGLTAGMRVQVPNP
ncbi:peptidoglycan-binding protein [Rathayibacter soli]|uniref:peptidoglycan-binding protein n=1 Tax=Rathayibacter soli TaxID=3144168 RepID=UPI0027E517CF|nr:peptidoglycan-binding protein [Glaciibacter superstes]